MERTNIYQEAEQFFIKSYEFKKDYLRRKGLPLFREILEEAGSLIKEVNQEKDGMTAFVLESYGKTKTYIGNTSIQDQIEEALITAEAVNRARTIANLPNNYLHPQDFVNFALLHAEKYNLDFEVLGQKELEALGCGGILAVNQGSNVEPKLVVIRYKGGEGAYRALIGKGLMYDSGGYHLKSADSMEGMHYDMCGAANVLGVLELLSRRKAKCNVLAVIPAVENLIGPNAMRGGDVITTFSGKTVDVVFTDAEGRLVLCDAITYAVKQGCVELMDIATLTYSCVAALGSDISGIFSNDESIYHTFSDACKRTGEKVWRLPLDDCFRKQLKETMTADLRNYTKGTAGASVAACFLEAFTDGLPWIHLDVVGTSVTKKPTEQFQVGATGVLIRSMANYYCSGESRI